MQISVFKVILLKFKSLSINCGSFVQHVQYFTKPTELVVFFDENKSENYNY